MKGQHLTRVSNPTYKGIILKMGVALYDRAGGFPSWALVFHPESFSADNVRIYRIVNDSENWFSDCNTCALQDLGPLVGVLRVSERGIRVPSPKVLDMFMSSFSPGREENNSSYESLWSTSSWVMRVLEHFNTVVKFPHRDAGKLFLYIRERIVALKAMPLPRPGRIRVIPLVSDADAMLSSSSSQVPVPVTPILRAIAKQDRESEGKLPTHKPITT